jgi:hypothetical protein
MGKKVKEQIKAEIATDVAGYLMAAILAIWLIVLTIGVIYLIWFQGKPLSLNKPLRGMVRYNEAANQFEYWGRPEWDDGVTPFMMGCNRCKESDNASSTIPSLFCDWRCIDCKLKSLSECDKIRVDFQRQLDCLEVGGHKWEFVRKEVAHHFWIGGLGDGPDSIPDGYFDDIYLFKCSKCGKEIKKVEDELTVGEKSALIELGIIDP